MTNTFQRAFLAGLTLALIPSLQGRPPKADADIEISIRVYNYAGLSDSVLGRAQRVRRRVRAKERQ